MINMAAPIRCLGRVLIHQRHSISQMAYQTPPHPCSAWIQVPNRHFAAARKPEKKTKKGTKEKSSDEKKDEIEKIKSTPFMEGEPEDDVYLKRLYPRQIYEVEKAIHLLKKFQILDFTNPAQGVYLDLTLDMALGKKKKVEPFASVLRLPYPFVSEINKVAVFTGSASEIKIAEENGAAFAGGTNLIQKILDDEIQPDFYVAVPEIMPELNPLKKKLKKRFPKLTRTLRIECQRSSWSLVDRTRQQTCPKNIPICSVGDCFLYGDSIGRDIPKMLELFKTGHEIRVDEERENFLETKIATLNMSSAKIAANLQAVISEVCRHRPLDLGPFVVRAFLRSSTSEGLLLKIEPLLPKEVETKESQKEAA